MIRIKNTHLESKKDNKAGYVYSFNIRNHKNQNEINPFGVNVLTDYECERTDGDLGLSQYIKRYIDLDSEEIKIEVRDNPYFNKADIVGYDWGSGGGEGEWESIDEDAAKEIIRKYCHDVKHNNIHFEATGENVAYFYHD
ncbi:MAG: hypothetical protein ACQEWU_10290 [Bacillota bacterium]